MTGHTRPAAHREPRLHLPRLALSLAGAALLAACAGVPTAISDKMPAIPFMDAKPTMTIMDRMRAEDVIAKAAAAKAVAPTTAAKPPPDPSVDLNNRRVSSYIVPSPGLTAYLNRLLAQIKQVSPRPDLPAHVYAVFDHALVADTTPAGNIFISLGWLRTVESEDELIALMAHEYGHLALHHYDFDEIANSQKRLKLLSTGFFLARQMMDKGSTNVVLSLGDTDKLKTQENLIQVMDAVIHPGWKRAQELDADKYALDTMVLLKRARPGMNDFFARIETQEQADKLALASAVASQPAKDKFSWQDVLQAGLTHLKADTHPPAADRVLAVDNYGELFYPADSKAVRIKKNMGALSKVVAENKVLFDNYETARSAQLKLTAGNVKEATVLARQSLSGPTARHAYPLVQLYQAQLRAGAMKDAERTWNLIKVAEDPTWFEYEVYMAHTTDSQKVKDANYELGYQKFQQAPVLQASRIAYYRKAGNAQMASQLMIACTARTPEYRDDCEKSLK